MKVNYNPNKQKELQDLIAQEAEILKKDPELIMYGNIIKVTKIRERCLEIMDVRIKKGMK
jgi:hypothetical protein